jgi:hypothetical protein
VPSIEKQPMGVPLLPIRATRRPKTRHLRTGPDFQEWCPAALMHSRKCNNRSKGMPELLDPGSPRDRNAIDLATSRNRRIPNARRREQMSLTGTYNCIGMAFANRRTSIEPHHVQMILEDDGYVEVDPADVVPGDLLVYRDRDRIISHVAVVISHEPDFANARWKTTVMSPCGYDGEYVHEHADVNPLLGRPDKFYSERKRKPA